jgi:VanZ family protein
MPRLPRLPLPLWRCLFALCAVAVLALALLPSAPLPTTGWDKLNHFLAFSVLFLLGRQAFPQRVWTLAAALVLYGGLIEVLQSLTPDRSADWQDIVADSIGIAIGLLVDQAARRALAWLYAAPRHR